MHMNHDPKWDEPLDSYCISCLLIGFSSWEPKQFRWLHVVRCVADCSVEDATESTNICQICQEHLRSFKHLLILPYLTCSEDLKTKFTSCFVFQRGIRELRSSVALLMLAAKPSPERRSATTCWYFEAQSLWLKNVMLWSCWLKSFFTYNLQLTRSDCGRSRWRLFMFVWLRVWFCVADKIQEYVENRMHGCG